MSERTAPGSSRSPDSSGRGARRATASATVDPLSAASPDPPSVAPPGDEGSAAEPPGRTWSRHALVVLRIVPGEPTAEGRARVARVARTLTNGELLAVRSRADWPVGDLVAADDRLRVAGCRFAPDDNETFIWAAPPDRPDQPEPPAAGTLDVRDLAQPLPILVTALAVARLGRGEELSVMGARRSPLLADLLAGRGDVTDGPATEAGPAVTRIVRR